ncbi:formate dehydrogenase subunit gamma [Oceanicella actignis]|uniref:Formate dehydrogenase subunit gamma n=1 Tax=Oceanicella actignis TaxID=1189325 RepID=A0A1M7TV68_9RHOB|nr:formate dehydrogenase subunit gamma [Oceanicella actignis]SES79573.1 formate dehydrogenase gamma subunit [Oceanicella actignis]SHN74570.1 formate dehydrogenase subunit gamma [Oceanicella actignis]
MISCSQIRRAVARLTLALGAALLLAAAPAPNGAARAEAVVAPAPPAPTSQTLEDILRRQAGDRAAVERRRAANPPLDLPPPMGMRAPLGTLGGASDADVWRALRFGTAEVTVSTRRPVDRVLVQDGGMRWLAARNGPLREYGLWAMGGMLALLAVFYLLRGPIRIEGGRSGVKVRRFAGVERFAHWLLASSFIVLALTGLMVTYGRPALIPLMGKEAFAALAAAGKWAHNNVAWAFMAGLVMVFVMWVGQNLPNRHDLKWLAMGGGFFGGGHPPSRKFNAGQKLIFWSVVVLGASLAVSGLSLLFPFELPLFAATFAHINDLAALAGFDAGLPTQLAPHEEMQLASIWHAIVALGLTTIILAHIYIGTIGMEGGFEAMGSGEVDRNWAAEHHNLWLAELEAQGKAPAPSAPAGQG